MRNWFSQRHVAQTVTDTPTLAPSPKVRTLSRDALHVFVLTSFAVAQPVYDRLGDRPAFLVDQDVSPATLAVLVFLLSIVLPATIVFIETALACWKRRFQDSVHALVVFASLVLLSLSRLISISPRSR